MISISRWQRRLHSVIEVVILLTATAGGLAPVIAAGSLVVFILEMVGGVSSHDTVGNIRSAFRDPVVRYVANLVIAAMNLGLVLVVLRRLFRQDSWSNLATYLRLLPAPDVSAPFRAFVLGACLTAIGFTVLIYRVTLAGLAQPDLLAYTGALGGFAARDLLAIATEEIVFRGFVLQRLERDWGALIAIVASSVLFALLHFASEPFAFPRALLLSFLGILLAACFRWTGSLWVCGALHFGWDQGVAWLDLWVKQASVERWQAVDVYFRSPASAVGALLLVTAGVLSIRIILSKNLTKETGGTNYS